MKTNKSHDMDRGHGTVLSYVSLEGKFSENKCSGSLTVLQAYITVTKILYINYYRSAFSCALGKLMIPKVRDCWFFMNQLVWRGGKAGDEVFLLGLRC